MEYIGRFFELAVTIDDDLICIVQDDLNDGDDTVIFLSTHQIDGLIELLLKARIEIERVENESH